MRGPFDRETAARADTHERPVYWCGAEIEQMTREAAIAALYDSISRFHECMVQERLEQRVKAAVRRYAGPPILVPDCDCRKPGGITYGALPDDAPWWVSRPFCIIWGCALGMFVTVVWGLAIR